VRRRVLAGVVAIAAIEAEIRKIGEVGFGKDSPLLYRRENREIPLALATRVSYALLPLAVFDKIRL
jgi:hypothetical protein